MNKPSVLTFAAVGVLLLGLTGCTGVAAVNDSPAQPSDAEVAEPAPAKELPKFGSEYVYDDGVAITVGAPAPFTPSAYAAGADQANNLRFTLTIRNGSDKPLDPYTYPGVTSGGVEASSIIDMDNKLELGPTNTILPGNTITWDVGYSVTDPADLTFQVSPGMTYTEVLFTN